MKTENLPRKSLLGDRLRFESMLVEMSSRFVHIDAVDVDTEIDEFMRKICQHLDLDLSALWQSPKGRSAIPKMTHLYRPYGGPPIPEDFDPREYFPWSLEQMKANRMIRLSSLGDVPLEGARDLETWAHFGIKTVLTLPISANADSVVGLMSFHSIRDEHDWSDEIVNRLELVSQIFGSALCRKRADGDLRESEERLQLAALSAEIGMWSFDIENQLFWTNDRGREIFGFNAGDEISLQRFLESVHPESRDFVADSIRQAVETNARVDLDYRVVLANGGEKWIHSCGRLQPESVLRPACLLGASVDISERKASEEALKKSFEEVEQLRRQLERENAYLRRENQIRFGCGRIVGESPVVLELLMQIEKVAPTRSTVLVEGETGTGKELVACRIHELSPRTNRPLIKVNCAALPSSLVESELFGREKGAFTGAVSREPGRFEVADGSTIFLDEIAELPIELQAKLLRVLEEGQFERVGSSRTLKTDVRVIAATNRDLQAEVDAGRFRSDLFYRLAVFPIKVPPLRERRGDIPLLVWSFVQELCKSMNKAVETIRQKDMEVLQRYDWPGNVRELRNAVERALILCNGPNLLICPPNRLSSDVEGSLDFDEAQRRHILKVLEMAGGQIRGAGGAAELMNLKPTTLRSKMQRLGLDSRRFRDDRPKF